MAGDATAVSIITGSPDQPPPGIARRLASMAYDLLLLAGVVFISTYVFLLVGLALDESSRRPLLQFFVLAVCGCYFTWFWLHGGQTLAMKTWRLRLCAADGKAVSKMQAVMRYLFACLLLPLWPVSILWALFDRDRQFLYDRL